MAISIRPLEEADIPTSVNVELEAFRSHPRIPMLWPHGYTDDVLAYYTQRKTDAFHDPNDRFMKAVDSQTGRILAISEWTLTLDPAAEGGKKPTDPNEKPPANWPRNGNWGIRTFFKIEWENWRRTVLQGKPYMTLNILVTHPDCQKRGAGALLMAWGCEQADSRGITMVLESTPAGMKLYKRYGFTEMRTVSADMREFGWTKPYDAEAAKRVFMLRQPRAQPT